jgi:hypothetical protein
MAVRIALGLVAVVILAWLGLMERDAHLQERGVDAASQMIVSGTPTPEGFRSAESDLRASRLLRPDTTPDLHRAVLYRVHGHERQSQELLEDIVEREPDNVIAWNVLLSLTRERDPAVARRAAAAQRRLNPLRAAR